MRKISIAFSLFFAITALQCHNDLGNNVTNVKILGNWKLVRATCTSEENDTCWVGLQLCPSFYSFQTNQIKIYESSYGVLNTSQGSDTTIYCYDSLRYSFYQINDTLYRDGGDDIIITFKNDTLVFKRIMKNVEPKGSTTYYFTRELQAIPYCDKGCTKRS